MTATDEYAVRFGRRVAQARAEHGWSMRELGERAGIAATAVMYAERGRPHTTLSVATRLAQALGVPLDQLVREPQCVVCDDAPPAGFTCNECKTARAPETAHQQEPV